MSQALLKLRSSHVWPYTCVAGFVRTVRHMLAAQ